MSNILLVTASQIESVRKMANEKQVGRQAFQRALDDGRVSRFLDSLKSDGAEVPPISPPPHLYEFRIDKDGADVATLVARTRQTFFVSDYAEAMTLNTAEFVIGPKEKVLIRVFTCGSLGVAGWSETDFFGSKGFEHVRQFGLLPCFADDAFGIRTAHDEQKLDEWILVAHTPISASSYRRVFLVGHDRGLGRYVYGYNLNSDYRLNPDSLVTLRVAS